jgi:hypothetical protein
MKISTKKLFFALAFCTSIISTKAQVYSEDFDSGSCNTTFPANWNPTPDWLIDDNQTTCLGGVNECNVAGSSGGSMLAGADGSSGLETVTSASFAASGFTGLTVEWNGYRSTGAPTTTLEYSFDDVTYTVVAFTDVTTDDAWHALTPVSLPGDCDNAPVIYLRWSYTGAAAGAFIAFDDIMVNGAALTIFYWNGGAPHLTTSWGVNLDGTGANPPNFTTAQHVYNFYNNTGTSFAPTLSANWTVSGGSVFINVGDGATRLTNFTIPSGFSLSLTGGTITVPNSCTLTLANTTFPAASQVSLGAGSTIDFAQSSAVTLYNKTYENLTLSGGGNKLQSGNTTVNGILNLAASNFSMTNSSLQTLTLNGSITGSGSILTGNSRLVIGGTGAFGTITFGVGSTSRTINRLTLNRTSSGSLILGSGLTVSGITSLTNGTVNLNGNSLNLNGAITFWASASNGAFTSSSATSFSIGGGGTITNSIFFDQTSAATRSMNDIFLNRSGVTLTLGNALEVYGSLTPSVGTIASGSNLTLKSSATSKARIGIISATGAFTGNPRVEVFKSAGKTNWVNLCSGGVTGGNMSGWNSSFAITCQTCPDGWVVGTGTFTSIYTYDETAFVGDDANAAHYKEISGLTSIDSKTGYWVYLGNGFPNTTAITIPLQGSGVNTKSSVSYNLSLTGAAASTNGWNLISNPYPSPVLVSEVINSAGASNVDNMLYVFDSNANTNVVYSATGTNSIIPMGQAFAIRALVNPVVFSPIETWKTPTNSNLGLLKTSASYTPNYFFDDFLIDLSSTTITQPFFSSAYFTFDPTATTGFDNGKDAFLIGNSVDPGLPYIYSNSGTQKYIRNALPSLSGTVIIPLTVKSGTTGVFKFTPVNLNKLPAGACVKLYDIVKGTLHDLKTGPYTGTVTANATTPKFELRITIAPGTLTSSQNDPLCSNSANGSIIAQGSSSGPWNYTWKDAASNILKVSTNKTTADTLYNLNTGIYQVDVNSTGLCDNANATFSLVSSSALPAASFTVNNDSLGIFGPTQFMFTNNSTNANSYFWTFGDGNTSTLQNPSYMYTNAGTYNVTLYAINSVCGDTTTYNYNVYAFNNTSVATLAASDNYIKIGQDANGMYVQLNYDKSTKATVSVTNVLGQVLIAPKTIEGAIERFYINVNAKDQLLFITVTTGDKRVTERLFSNQ